MLSIFMTTVNGWLSIYSGKMLSGEDIYPSYRTYNPKGRGKLSWSTYLEKCNELTLQKPYWSYLNEKGYTVGLFTIPLTFPPPI
jgi:predicted AlkP superfamily phosphohydrolase/phosphomutase